MKLGGMISDDHRRKVGEGVSKAWKRRYPNFVPKSPSGILNRIKRLLRTDNPLWAVEYLEESHRQVCWRLQQCVQTHKIGMGGENVADVVCDKLDALLGKSSRDFK